MSDLVSVILPVYNGAKYLRPAIESILAQTYQDWELVVVDDCSTDDSAAIIESYASADKRIVFERNQTNRGLFPNYNRAIELSRGEYIKPFAQDDLLYPDCLKKGVEALKNNPGVALVTSGRHFVDGSGKELETVVPFKKEGITSGRSITTWSLITLTNFIGEPVVGLFRARDKSYGYDTRYFHYGDVEYWLRLLQNGDMYFIPDVLCAFRRHEGAATRRNHHTMLDILDAIRLGHQYFSYLEAIGENREHFHSRVVEFAAMQVDHRVKHEEMGEGAMRRNGADRGPGSRPDLQDDFAEALYHALRYIPPMLSEMDHLKRCREKDHVNFDAEIKKIHASMSWKVTAPLRALRHGSRAGN